MLKGKINTGVTGFNLYPAFMAFFPCWTTFVAIIKTSTD
jgi:hypothetical protein